MSRPIDLVVGAIYDLEHDRCAGWSAYFAADDEKDAMKREIEQLKEKIRRLKNVRRKK